MTGTVDVDLDPTLPCAVCKKPLFNIVDDVINQPSDAVVFTATGAYGSAVFDPIDSTTSRTLLEINICDKCILQLGDEQAVLISRGTYQSWTWVHEHWTEACRNR